MPFTRKSLQGIVDQIVSDFQTRITGATSLLRRSVLRVIARVNAGAFHLLYEYLDYQARQLFATTGDEAGLETIASEYGITRNAATYAVGSGTTTPCTNGVVIPASTQLISTDDQIYETDEDVTVAAGAATVAFTAIVAGADGNDDAGITLTFVSPIAGVNTSLTVDADGIYDGADEETDEELRARVLARKRQPPHGGAEFDYETWALEVSGVTRAWTFPLYMGVGTIGVAFVRDDDDSIIPNAPQMAEVRAYIVEHEDPGTGKIVGCPVTAEPGLFMVTLTLQAVNFEIAIYPNTAAVRDAVEDALTDLIVREGGPGEMIYLSEINETISLTSGEEHHRLDSPVVDVTAVNKVHVLGTVAFTSY